LRKSGSDVTMSDVYVFETHTHTHTHIYIYRERERERAACGPLDTVDHVIWEKVVLMLPDELGMEGWITQIAKAQ